MQRVEMTRCIRGLQKTMNFMKKLFAMVLVLVMSVSELWAQDDQQPKKKEKKVYLYGYLSDSFTGSYIPDVKVVVLRPDSTLVDSAEVNTYDYNGIQASSYYLKVPAKSAKYIIKATHPDYETTCVNYEIKRVARNREFEAPSIRMRRIHRSYDREGGSLDDVTVTATRVKMVYKGDTIVFNADAFNIPEGSMLDGLIKQLPGVELKENGEIFVNGKKIDNLTLNGADFFKGKNKMMLENLPYYTVKNVQVYNKRTPKSEFLGRDVEEKEYTMDVVLKKEYAVGGTVNLEAGASPGASSGGVWRYKARGFGLRYTNRTRAVLFGGVNNVNEYMDYDDEGNERDRTQASGDRDIKMIGGMFSLHTPEERVSNDLEFKLNWEDIHTELERTGENFLAGASTFSANRAQSNSRPFKLTARNTFYIRKPVYLHSWLNINYNRDSNNSENWALTANDQLMTDSINHTWSISRWRSNRLQMDWDNHCDIKLPWGDELELSTSLFWSRQWGSDSFSQDHYTYYNTHTTDQRNQYSESPQSSYNISANLAYRLRLTEHFTIAPNLGMGYNYNNNDLRLYRLDWLGAEWAVDGRHPLGSLPVIGDSLLLALDAPNSSEQGYRENQYEAGMGLTYSKQTEEDKDFLYSHFSLSRQFRRKHMHYDSDVLHTTINRNENYWKANWHFQYSFDNYHKEFYIYGQNSTYLPDISQLADITQTNNPLYIRKGNPNLKPETNWWCYASFRSRVDSLDQHFNISLDGSLTHNAITTAYTYNPTTGVRTTWSENVNGNWNMRLNIAYGRALGEKKFWHIGSYLNATVGQSTDMSSVQSVSTESQQTELQRNRVTTTRLAYTPSIRFQKEKLSFTLKGDVAWRHIHRSIEVDGLPVNTYDFSYGFNANYKLLWGITLDTDLQMHSNRGYADEDLNNDRLYWDATLTKSWNEGRWIAKLKAYDILGQVSQWQYYVNSQGRTETWTNNMRRYVMLTLAFRFSVVPKK